MSAGSAPGPGAVAAASATYLAQDSGGATVAFIPLDIRLANAVVSVRGTVVKYNAAVMGKNWIHLQDGSGDATKGTHDITVTTMDVVSVGATVTITGTLVIVWSFVGDF